MDITDEIIKLTGSEPGPAVMVIAGTHGEERAGILALQELMPTLRIKSGTLYMAFANPEADRLGVRFTGKNMNRCFYEGNTGTDYEDIRARELMAIFDRCDALLDLHSFGDEEGEPFAICEDISVKVALNLAPNIIITNWTTAQPKGTDSYMWFKGKVGIGVECGSNAKADKYKLFAIRVIKQFLASYNMLDYTGPASAKSKRIFAIRMGVQRTDERYQLDPRLKHLQRLRAGQVIGSQGAETYVTQHGDHIVFPRTDPIIGSQAFLLAQRTKLNG